MAYFFLNHQRIDTSRSGQRARSLRREGADRRLGRPRLDGSIRFPVFFFIYREADYYPFCNLLIVKELYSPIFK
jgi:hypothetical protein